MEKEEKKIIEKFFAHFPVSHAIPRANEALAMRTVKLNPPVLDLGCGDGKFAFFAFGRKKIAVGLDKNAKEVKKAKKSQAYQKVITADASKLPFVNQRFGTIIANSVLEHLENLDRVVEEANRVLKINGLFVLTVPTPSVSRYQFWSKFIPGWAQFKERLWHHINYFGETEWQRRLRRAGFKMVLVRKTNSRSAIKWADIFFPLVPFGSIQWLIPFLEKRKVFGFNREGATLLLVAEKNGRSKN